LKRKLHKSWQKYEFNNKKFWIKPGEWSDWIWIVRPWSSKTENVNCKYKHTKQNNINIHIHIHIHIHSIQTTTWSLTYRHGVFLIIYTRKECCWELKMKDKRLLRIEETKITWIQKKLQMRDENLHKAEGGSPPTDGVDAVWMKVRVWWVFIVRVAATLNTITTAWAKDKMGMDLLLVHI
jgi:hypothetical protein